MGHDSLLYNKRVFSRFARGGQRGELNSYLMCAIVYYLLNIERKS